MLNFHEYVNYGFWALQFTVGIIFIVHGWGKLKAPEQIASAYGAPKAVGTLHGLVEMIGGFLLITNFFVQIVAIVFGIIMLGAIYYKVAKWHVPFMAYDKTGWEFDLLILASCIAILLK